LINNTALISEQSMKKYTKYKSRLEASKAFNSNGFKLTVLEHPQSQVGLEYFKFSPFRK